MSSRHLHHICKNLLNTHINSLNRNICKRSKCVNFLRMGSTFTEGFKKLFKKSKGNESISAKIGELNLRYVFVRTCVDFWTDIPVGVMFDTAYLDTHPGISLKPDTPVIVALHDTPGSLYDMIPILQPFCNLGYRVVAPNFPDKIHTRGMNRYDDTTFSGKTDERVTFIHDFLQTIGIERIDMLIGQGSGCNTVISYTANLLNKHAVRSIALLSPIGHKPGKALKEYPAVLEFDMLWNKSTLFKYPLRASLEISAFHKFPVLRTYRQSDRLKVMLHFAGFQYEWLNSDSFGIGSSSIPRLMTYNLNNKLVDKDLMEEYTDLLGIPETNVCHCETVEQVKSPENNNTALKCVAFEDKDYTLNKYSGQLTLLLQDLLKNVIKKKW
ncbi:uncharacterized protein [Mytilus edulis]|uniref:uncharacterized protein n=1 Tax=Mytilus edulis TaxID=6550 RepID=UPI0039EE249F